MLPEPDGVSFYASATVFSRDRTLFFVGGTQIVAFDTSDPANPVEIAKISGLHAHAADADLDDTMIYTAGVLHFCVVDVSDPVQMNEIGYLESSEVSRRGIVGSGDYVYVGGDALRVFRRVR